MTLVDAIYIGVIVLAAIGAVCLVGATADAIYDAFAHKDTQNHG